MAPKPKNAKEARLLGLSLFKNADEEAIGHLASAADEVSVEAGRVLITQDRHHNEIFVIESGSASVEVDGNQVAEIPEGEFVGELGFFVRSAASATVKAKTDMSLLVIPYNRFDQILNDNPKLVRAIAAELAERLVDTNAQL